MGKELNNLDAPYVILSFNSRLVFDGFWMGDLEISVINKIYEATLYIYELREDQNFYLLSKYGDINDGTKLFLNLCFVNNNHYNVLYETKGG